MAGGQGPGFVVVRTARMFGLSEMQNTVSCPFALVLSLVNSLTCLKNKSPLPETGADPRHRTQVL